MTIPDFQTIMLPFLQFSSDGKMHNFLEVVDALAKKFKLTPEEIDTLIPSGQQRFANRVGWAKTYLKKAGLIDYPQRGNFQITQRGFDVLKENPEAIDMKFLKRFPEYQEFRKTNQVDEGKEEVVDLSDKLPLKNPSKPLIKRFEPGLPMICWIMS